MWKVKRTLLEDACLAARNFYPKEFLCFLGGDKKKEIIEEVIFLPTESSENTASVNELNIPFDDTIVGSLHSHPSGANSPSRQDKKFFLKYQVNLILGYPYTPENVAFFNKNGERTKVVLLY